ncbi:hypothetical protein EG329_011654 [Mollisiaceae sp. DMI_Dod_QoI]|nr:hypothetical protein EG329_011654 [Helotiales sp. DMI_Dod_QoI]
MASDSSVSLGTEHVHLLNNDNFDEFANSRRFVWVMFTHPRSGRYSHFRPIYEKIAKHGQDDIVKCAVVDTTESYDLLQRLNIDGWNRGAPSLFLFNGIEKRKMYRGALREKEITEYLLRQKSPLVSKIDTNSLKSFQDQNDIVVVGYLSTEDTELYEFFEQLARSLHDDYLFGVSSDQRFVDDEWVIVPSIVVYKHFDEGKVVRDLTPDLQIMRLFVKEAAQPLIHEFLPEIHDDLLDAGISLGYIFTDGSTLSTQLAEVVKDLDRQHKNIHFGTWDLTQSPEMGEDLRLTTTTYPKFAIREPVKNYRYPLNNSSQPLEQALPEFVSDYLHGKLKPSIKSAPVPIPTTPPNPLIEVVSTTFSSIVHDPTRDVFIEFCTPWCGPCRALLPLLEGLARLYHEDERWKDKVVIAKMDAEANDTEGGDIRMFPTFRLYPAAKDGVKRGFVEFVETAGPRRVEDWARFIGEEGTWKAVLDVKKGVRII